MAVYVMSDIHGEYEKYCEMLKKIDFNDNDTLFILGDVVDRGARPIDVLLDMMKRPNIYPLMGNHDLMALDMLKKLNVEISEENFDKQLSADDISELTDWLTDGGEPTITQFRALSKEQRANVLDYISEFSLYAAVDVEDKAFILVHASLGNFRKDKKLHEYSLHEMLAVRHDPEKQYFDDDDIYVVTGHTPTLLYSGKAEIYKKNRNICIDCAASMGGRLACLCLDTMEEFYC